MNALERLARAAGIAVIWRDANGQRRRVSPDSLRAILAALGYPAAGRDEITRSLARLKRQADDPPLRVVPQGDSFPAPGRKLLLIAEGGERHALAVRNGKTKADVPPGYYRVSGRDSRIAVTPHRAFQPEQSSWGVSVQLYALRGSPGIGDFAALGRFCEDVARAGADAVMLSPVHALPHKGISPYTPSSRQFLNPLYIPATGLDQGGPRIDWTQAARRRIATLRRAFNRFPLTDDAAFRKFVRQGGSGLREYARAAAKNARDVRFQLYLQWRADMALAEAQARAKQAGMTIGIITDVAVGLDPGGSEAAAHPREILHGLSIGAPPDAFANNGQDWGLTSYSPAGLIATGYDGFIRTLRGAMRHAGGIRLDHAMGLMRLWIVPQGRPAHEGAYLSYPFEDLLGLLCLESQRHRALVIAEDLGVVPRGFRRRIQQAGLLGMTVLWFARDNTGKFQPPVKWPKHNAALTTTHDLPTLAGWWKGRDLEWRARIMNTPAKPARLARENDRRALWCVLRESGAKGPPPKDAAHFADAVIAAFARARTPLKLVAIEDLTGESEQPNIPGTIDEHPNWRRRLKTAHPFNTRSARRRAALLTGAA